LYIEIRVNNFFDLHYRFLFFNLFQVCFYHIFTYFAHIAALNAVTDDTTQYIKHRMFDTNRCFFFTQNRLNHV